jgi:FkbM family methyltransferase
MPSVALLPLLASHLSDLGRYPRYLWRLWRRPARVRLRGVTFELDAETSPTLRRLLYSERYERSESRCAVVALSPDDVVLEVGSGLGYLSTICALRLGSERVHTYEADPALIPGIRRHHTLNGVAPELHNAMLAGSTGSASFFVAAHFFSSSATAPHPESPGLDVPTLDVRAEFARLRPTFVLMDIEGGEGDLVPLIDWSGVRKLAIELHPELLGEAGLRALLATLAAAGFEESRLLSGKRKRYFHKRGRGTEC